MVAYPTLENLFGSLDYCDCQDCGSILSPAAYLVDLLHYPTSRARASGDNPQDVLLARRPDLQYLPLTCANTNTALPYIDLVNEALEYFVANGLSLAGYQGHDTGDTVTSAELIASPQYVDDAAYAVAAGRLLPAAAAVHPAAGAAAAAHERPRRRAAGRDGRAARQRRASPAPADPAATGGPTSSSSRLGISRDEYRMFTDPSLQLGDLWGLPAGTALSTLQAMSLADLSRRLGVSYDDLALIVTTQFINPNAALIPRLTRLNASFATLKELHDNLDTPPSSPPASSRRCPPGSTPPSTAAPARPTTTPSSPGSPARTSTRGSWTSSRSPTPASTAADCSGADLLLRYANPDVTANALTADDYTG